MKQIHVVSTIGVVSQKWPCQQKVTVALPNNMNFDVLVSKEELDLIPFGARVRLTAVFELYAKEDEPDNPVF